MAKLTRALRQHFPQAHGEKWVASAEGGVVPPGSKSVRGRVGKLHLSDQAVYSEVSGGVLKRKLYQRIAIDELVAADTSTPPSRFGTSDVYVRFWSENEEIAARLWPRRGDNSQAFVDLATGWRDAGEGNAMMMAQMFMLAWELAEDEAGASDMVDRVCSANPEIVVRIAEVIIEFEAEDRDFGDDDITENALRAAGYLATRQLLLDSPGHSIT